MKSLFSNLFVQDSSNVFAENRLLKFGFVAVVIFAGLQTATISSKLDEQRVHLIPIGGQGDFVISGSTASDDYLRSMSRYIVHMAGDLSAATARRQLNELLPLIHPDEYSRYRDLFTRLADGIERYPTVSYVVQWRGNRDIKKVGDDTIHVAGVKKRIVGDSVTSTENVTYHISYSFEQGRFWLTGIKEVSNDA